ncbi:MAG: ribbon-helix-helix protein, CopG family [Acidobacteriota bacterium]
MNRRQVGPRGGETTRKRGQVKKTVWINDDEAEVLRKIAYEEHRSEASIVREALREYLGLEE